MIHARRFYDSASFTKTLILASAITAVTVLVMVSFLVWLSINLTQPPVKFTQRVYVATQPIVCPGDSLQYTAQVLVYQDSMAPTIVNSWWSVDKNSQATSGISVTTAANVQIWTGTPVFVISIPVSETVPALDPGNYEHRGAIRLSQPYAMTYRVKFTIPDVCPVLPP